MDDFRYSGFWISKDRLKDYTENTVEEKKYTGKRRQYYNSNIMLTTSIIRCIAGGEVEFNVKDTELCNLLEDMIIKCGTDDNGVYTAEAHQAMQKLCVMRGMAPNAIKLRDKTNSSIWERASTKIKGFFGWGKKKEAPTVEQKIDPVVEKKTTTKPSVDKKANSENKSEVIQPRPQTANTSKRDNVIKTLAGTASVALMGLSFFALMSLRGCDAEKQDKTQAQPNTKTQTYTQKTITDTLNIQPVVKPMTPAARPTPEQMVKPVINPHQAEEIAKINACCNSSLNILIGEQAREKLYAQVRRQVERGIFQIPNGMSVERVAHAITMSRIYEGKSVIIDALNATQKLTPSQQAAFADHIEGIGVNGVKLQKRMAAKQKLSSHSKYDQASKAMKKTHAKNLKELRQMRGHNR